MGYRRPDDASSGSRRAGSIKRVLWAILFLNLGVAVAKLAVGIMTRSSAMQADGFHSMFDGTSNIVGLVGMALAARPADRDHPYGHGKYETYASAMISAMLAFAAYNIGSNAIRQLAGSGSPAEVDFLSFAVMIGTLAVNIFVTTWERRVGRKLNSQILVADASHTGSDVMVSLGVIVSLVLVRLGFAKADPVVALLVAVAIFYTAWGVFKQANATLSDSARLPKNEVYEAALAVPGVLGCHDIRTRGSDVEVYVDLHIQVEPSQTVAQGHQVAEEVERQIARVFSQVVDVIVHLEPLDDYQKEKTEKDAVEPSV